MKTKRKGVTNMRKHIYVIALVILCSALSAFAETKPAAGGGDAATEMARKLNNPLANIHAVMTDNSINFNTGSDNGTSYAFQFQPVYAMDFPDAGFSFIPRAVIPIMGLEPGTDLPMVGDPVPAGKSVWGLGDIILQGFVAPHTDAKMKWGVGPQFSLATASDSDLRGADWGAGIAGVVTGNITENLSFSGIAGNLWSYDGDFSLLTLQAIPVYMINAVPGMWVGYNAVISYDWKAPSSDAWTVPVGLTVGRTFDMGGGNGLDINVGPYYNAARPTGAADWVLRFGISWIFP